MLMLMLLVAVLPAATAFATPPSDAFNPVQQLKDVSGMAYMGDDLFVGVHDAKLDEPSLPRVSLFKLPNSLDGIQMMDLQPKWPDDRTPALSNDLESAARIPGTRKVLLCESGDDASEYDRIYLTEVFENSIRIVDYIQWSSFVNAFNVEATAVARTDSGHIFLWAERNTSTIQWRDLQLSPFAIGTGGVSGAASFEIPSDMMPLSRPVVGLDVDSRGEIFAAAAYDDDNDFGPFRSSVFRIGRVEGDQVNVYAQPKEVTIQDGFKVECVARADDTNTPMTYFGTDDENYGGTIRPVFSSAVHDEM